MKRREELEVSLVPSFTRVPSKLDLDLSGVVEGVSHIDTKASILRRDMYAKPDRFDGLCGVCPQPAVPVEGRGVANDRGEACGPVEPAEIPHRHGDGRGEPAICRLECRTLSLWLDTRRKNYSTFRQFAYDLYQPAEKHSIK